MSIIRSFFLLFFFIVFSSSALFSTTLNKDHLLVWQSSFIDSMTPQDLQIIANYLYLLYANAIIESKVRQLTSSLLRLEQSIRLDIAENKNPVEGLTRLKLVIERLSYIINARSVYAQILNMCLKHYEQNSRLIIDTALESLQCDAQTKLRTWADNNSDITKKLLQQFNNDTVSNIQRLYVIAGLYKGMSEGDLPFVIPQNEMHNTSLFILDSILRQNSHVQMVADNVAITANMASDHLSQLVIMSVEIYKDYYTILYNKMTSTSFDTNCATTLFGARDILPQEHRSLLPHPENVFEHIFHIISMYPEIELLSQS
ncbi:MAG TPA: hypothetical protein VLB80_04790 [Candidatus Babeliales bacterium]|nr:hypothetical protein [Candidatus Babeliales bacterium]